MRKAVADKAKHLNSMLELRVGEQLSLTYPNPDAAHSARNAFYRAFQICTYDAECTMYSELDQSIKISKTKAAPSTLVISRRTQQEVDSAMAKNIDLMIEVDPSVPLYLLQYDPIDFFAEKDPSFTNDAKLAATVDPSLSEDEVKLWLEVSLPAQISKQFAKGLKVNNFASISFEYISHASDHIMTNIIGNML